MMHAALVPFSFLVLSLTGWMNIDSTLTIYRDLVENNRHGFRIH